MSEAKFKKGDKVRCIDNSGNIRAGFVVGEIYTVADASGGLVSVEGKTRDQSMFAYRFETFVPAQFEVGARVRLTDDNGGFGEKGAEGTVESAPNTPGNGTHLVRFDKKFRGYHTWYAGSKGNLELVKEETIVKKFKKGDKVRMIGYVGAARAGATTTVEGYQPSKYKSEKEYLHVIWNRADGLAKSQMDGGYNEEDFEMVVAPSPRFVTMWDYGHSFHPTGDKPFATEEEAEKHALAILNSGEHTSGTIAVFEVVGKHTVALTVTSEAA